ncbi:MAG: hypothetical protein ACI4MO_05760 [Christensenellales bacterium]
MRRSKTRGISVSRRRNTDKKSKHEVYGIDYYVGNCDEKLFKIFSKEIVD